MKSLNDDFKWDNLKKRAIKVLNTEKTESGKSMSDETVKLIQEMDVNRIELELQNQKAILALERAEKEKREYMELFDLSPSGLVEISADGIIKKINIHGAAILGQPRSALIGIPLSKFLARKSLLSFDQFLYSIDKEHPNNTAELSLVLDDQQVKDIEISGILNESYNTVFISMKDISSYKRTEEHLVKSREKAETADRHKSSFLSTMSHEIRAPLNSIIGFSGILLQEIPGKLNEEQKKQMGMIQSSGRHLLSMINDLLDLSKIEAGQLKINLESFNLIEVLEDVIQLEWPLAVSKNIHLELKTSPEIGVLHSDKQRIHQVLLNILNNALKFTEQGSVVINCYREAEKVKIEIKDTGIGIKEEDLVKIFDPFIQIENDLTKAQMGSGLGLPVTKKFLELLQGTLEVRSVFGEGTTFTVSLPV